MAGLRVPYLTPNPALVQKRLIASFARSDNLVQFEMRPRCAYGDSLNMVKTNSRKSSPRASQPPKKTSAVRDRPVNGKPVALPELTARELREFEVVVAGFPKLGPAERRQIAALKRMPDSEIDFTDIPELSATASRRANKGGPTGKSIAMSGKSVPYEAVLAAHLADAPVLAASYLKAARRDSPAAYKMALRDVSEARRHHPAKVSVELDLDVAVWIESLDKRAKSRVNSILRAAMKAPAR